MNPRAIHMIGIGGAGMSGLARLAVQAGYTVTGSDRDDSEVLQSLRDLGVVAHAGHASQHVPVGTGTVVVSTAIADDNPELVVARERELEILHRADLLAELMAGHRGAAVAGAHGKSTTSAMLTLALGGASACIGATVPGGEGTGAVWGEGPWFVAEADESDRSLLRLDPDVAILLNVDHDHHSTYASIDDVEQVFREFIAAIPADGVLIVGPDERARTVAAAARCAVRTVDAPDGSFCHLEDDGDTSSLVFADGRRVTLALAVPGRHNRTNAACAVALADFCGIDPQLAADRLVEFTGVGRRWEFRGVVRDIRVIDDYAHHPAEIGATLQAARDIHDGRLVVIFQPHLFSRTHALKAELAAALSAADVAIVTEIYAAREPHDPTISGRDVAQAVSPPAQAHFAADLTEALAIALAEVRSGDLVVTMGAGDITRLGQELVRGLQRGLGDGGDSNGSHAP